MFKHFKMAVSAKLALMVTHSPHLFMADVTKDEMWETYLNSFPEDVRQTYNCNCCRQFIKNYGNVVAIVDGETVSIWNVDVDSPEYKAVSQAMNSLILGKPVRDVFVTNEEHLGVDKNHQFKEGGEVITWEHFYFRLPKSHVTNRHLSVDSVRATYRDNKNVLKRSLDEMSIDAIDTVLELIAQKSLYRGDEHKGSVTEFRKLKVGYEEVPAEKKDNFCWKLSTNSSMSISRIRNTSIGTLLTDISEGRELDVAVSAFERIMAPANYKRPNAIITKRMIEDAEKTIQQLGLEESLGRRFATPEDITVNNVLFANRNAKKETGLLSDLKDDVKTNPKAFSKVEEITMEKFLKDIVPGATSIEVLFENKHMPNLVSVIAPKNTEAPSLFKWPNGFSWSYKDALADSMKERVKAAGGNVEGVLRFSIQWNEDGKSICDFDAHAIQPDGKEIYYAAYRGAANKTSMSGMLDVDMINPSEVGVENITWTDASKMRYGQYRMFIRNFNGRRNNGFSAEIEMNGEIHSFGTDKFVQADMDVAVVEYTKDGFSIKSLMPSTSSVKTSTAWGIETNKFHKVSLLMKSPNYWDDHKVGNEHLFFIIEGAHNDEAPRGFFNEFLPEDMMKHKRVFEALGGKMKVEPSHKQLSGLGFSSTTKGELIVKVEGAFTRTLKVKF